MWFTNYYVIWHLELLRGHQLKKTPCTILQANFSYVWHLFLFNLFTRPRLFLFNFFFQDQDVFNKPKLFDDPQMIFQYFPVFARKFFIVIFGQVFGGVQPGCACFILWRHGVERKLEKKRDAKPEIQPSWRLWAFTGSRYWCSWYRTPYLFHFFTGWWRIALACLMLWVDAGSHRLKGLDKINTPTG